MNLKNCLLFFILQYVLTSCLSNDKPDLILSKYQINFGCVREGTQCSADIKLYNKGKRVLILNLLTTDCSCAKALVDNKIIAPKDSTVVHVLLNTSDKNGNNENFVIIQANTDTVLHYVSIVSNVIANDSNL